MSDAEPAAQRPESEPDRAVEVTEPAPSPTPPTPGSESSVASPPSSTWGQAAGAGAFGGAIAGLIASYGSGKLGFAAFVVFIFVMLGLNGGSKKAIAALVFGVVAAVVAAIFRR